ncbi:MAG: hypothetical protein AB4080_19890 [Trichodesmium sp.]
MLEKNYRQKENLEQLKLIIHLSLLKILVLPFFLLLPSFFFLNLISIANAQEEDYSKPAERKISVPFFEEERKLQGQESDAFSSFSNTFLNDALGGTGDPMGGGTVPASDFTMSPNVSESEFSDPSRGVSPSRGVVRGGAQPSGGTGRVLSPVPGRGVPGGGGGRGIFQSLPPR